MTTSSQKLVTTTQGPGGPPTADTLRKAGLGLAALAVGAAMIAFVGAWSAAQMVADGGSRTDITTLAIWTFGLTTLAFGSTKLGIASVLLAIRRRVVARIDSMKVALPHLMPQEAMGSRRAPGAFDSAFGPAVATDRAPGPLAIHRLAGLMWLPMLAMAAMALLGGFVLALVAAGNVAVDPTLAASQRAWVQGLQFLGEGFALAGISFLLARILSALRSGGGEVQESLGLTVETLRMPVTAKLFVILMMAGLMVEIAQFIAYAIVAGMTDPTQITVASTWLGPLREFGLGLLLAGIVLALATIARALDFQTARVVQIITRGQ
ncbi:MAG: hypothetical protein WEG56_13835 [Chloroflexota bacterium]